MKKFTGLLLVLIALLASGCSTKYNQYSSDEGHFRILMPNAEDVMATCKTEEQVERCVAIASDKRIGGFFVFSERDVTGLFADFGSFELVNLSRSFMKNQCNPLGLNEPIFASLTEPKAVNLETASGTYPAARFEWYSCSGDRDLTGYVLRAEDHIFILYALGDKVMYGDNESTLKEFFQSFEYIP